MSTRANGGFTLIELVVVMALFSVVIMMVGNSFSTLLRYSARYMKSQESNIEGNVGLEVMRHDLSSAGFGLPTAFFGGAVSYSEVDTGHGLAAALNDATGGVPRALAGTYNLPSSAATADSGSDGNSYTPLAGSDYLAVKATSLGTDVAAQKWTYAGYSSVAKPPKTWSSANLADHDRVIVLDRSASDPNGNYTLLVNPAGQFWTSYLSSGLGPGFGALTPQDTAYIYGIAGNGATPRMPFNRADYVVATPPRNLLPAYCAPHTGVLYRGMVQHDPNGGNLSYQPLVDCVAAMHVVLGWNMLDSTGNVVTDNTRTGSGAVDTWTNVSGTGINSSGVTPPTLAQMAAPKGAVTDAGQVRTKLKVVKVYLLVQDGNRDPGYTSPNTINMYSDEEGMTPLGSAANFSLSPDMLNYRWKLYRLVVRPKNLVSNQ